MTEQELKELDEALAILPDQVFASMGMEYRDDFGKDGMIAHVSLESVNILPPEIDSKSLHLGLCPRSKRTIEKAKAIATVINACRKMRSEVAEVP